MSVGYFWLGVSFPYSLLFVTGLQRGPDITTFGFVTDIWVLASTLAHSALEINKALSVTYKLLFILSKNIVPSRSYRYIRDREFPVTACHPLYIQSLM